MDVALVMSVDEFEAAIRRAIEPLRLEVERLRSERSHGPIRIAEAARRLGVTPRSIQRWIKDGRLEAVRVGGLRCVVLPYGFR